MIRFVSPPSLSAVYRIIGKLLLQTTPTGNDASSLACFLLEAQDSFVDCVSHGWNPFACQPQIRTRHFRESLGRAGWVQQ
jgi:hypothetical protein